MSNKKIPQPHEAHEAHEAHIAYLHHLSASLTTLIEQSIASTTPNKQTQKSLLISCLIPGMTKEHWQSHLKQSPIPYLDACAALEVQYASSPNLYAYMQKIIAQTDTLLQDREKSNSTDSSHVNVKEKQFLFFGAMDHV